MTAFELLRDYGSSVAAFTVFALLHSVGAREPFKQALARWTSPFVVDHFWRIAYCALSFWALYSVVAALLWLKNPENDIWLVIYPEWLWQIVTALHLAAVAAFYIAFLQSDYIEFLGFSQAWRGLRALLGRPVRDSHRIFGTDRLEVRGIYGWVRHPMLSAGLLFLLTSGPSLNNLVYTAMYTAYMLIGGYFEERRLVRIFGDDYLRYRVEVGAFVPRLQRIWRS
jgi:methanethiol S-methyltransferase